MDQFHQADPAHLSSVYIGKEAVSGSSRSRLVAGASARGWDREVAGEIEQESFTECLVLGFLGVLLADISVNRISSEGEPEKGGLLLQFSAFSVFPALSPEPENQQLSKQA